MTPTRVCASPPQHAQVRHEAGAGPQAGAHQAVGDPPDAEAAVELGEPLGEDVVAAELLGDEADALVVQVVPPSFLGCSSVGSSGRSVGGGVGGRSGGVGGAAQTAGLGAGLHEGADEGVVVDAVGGEDDVGRAVSLGGGDVGFPVQGRESYCSSCSSFSSSTFFFCCCCCCFGRGFPGALFTTLSAAALGYC